MLCKDLLKVARGDSPADLLLQHARVVNTCTAEIEVSHVAVYRGYIAGIGDYRDGKRVVDLGGRYLVPGFINGHTHLESSLLTVDQYARAVVPRGTLAVVTDLHEIANVCGLAGVKCLLNASRHLTTWLTEEPTRRHGVIVPDVQRDVLKVVGVERHKATGNIGVALVRGFGLHKGALASSVAHDAHNIVAVGASDEDIYVAVQEVARLGCGLGPPRPTAGPAVGEGQERLHHPDPLRALLAGAGLRALPGRSYHHLSGPGCPL